MTTQLKKHQKLGEPRYVSARQKNNKHLWL